MQMKNSNTVAMDKRMDLASLFCMIGRHGPAVAVAVIAMVSVLAGFIIYRNVKGKRRKTRSGDDDCGSPGTQTDEDSRNRAESTDGNEDVSIKPDDEGPLGLTIRNRHAAEKLFSHLKKDCEQQEKLVRSPIQQSDHVQRITCAVATMQGVCQDVAEDETSVRENLVDYSQNCEEVLDTEENKMTTEDVCHVENDIQSNLEKLACSQLTKEKRAEEDVTPETRCESDSENPLIHDTEDKEKPLDHSAISGVLQSENDPPGCVECDFTKTSESTCNVENYQSVVSDNAIPTSIQLVEADYFQCDPVSIDVQSKQDVKEDVPSTSDNHSILNNLCSEPQLGCIEEENNSTKAVPAEESVEHQVLSSIKDTHAAVIENGSLTVATGISHAEVSSFSDQIEHLDLKMIPALAPQVTESMIPSSFEPIELLWSTAPGEESGISSMTVSPALEDGGVECDLVTAHMTHSMDCCQGSENPSECDVQKSEDIAVAVRKETAVEAPGSLPLSQKNDGELTNGTKSPTNDPLGQEDVYHPIGQSPVHISKPEKMDVKTEVVDQMSTEKTEISIMAATMDHNEWITDGNYQVLPWMNFSVPCLNQNKIGQESHNLVPKDQRRNGDDQQSEIKQTCPHVDESDKKVVAVQPMPQNVNVTFCTHYLTYSPSQTVAITGNQRELGNWKDFIPLERAKDGQWVTTVSLPVECHVEWKFVLLEKGVVCRWEECGNRLLDTGHGETMAVREWWGLL